MTDAHGLINNVWIIGDMMARMVNLGAGVIQPASPVFTPTDILLTNHNSATYARNSTTDPSTLPSVMQTRASTVDFISNFQFDSSQSAVYENTIWYVWNIIEWDFVPYVGATYTIEAAGLSGRTSGVYQDWAAFGPVKYPTVVNSGDIVVYLVSFFRVGYAPGVTP